MALTKDQKILTEAAKRVARELGNQGKSLSGLIGELSACQYLDLEWRPADGYDAVSKEGRRVQIKTRKSWSTDEINPLGTIGRFGRKDDYDFDDGLLVELGPGFETTQIWQLDKDRLRALEEKRAGRGLHVGAFKKYAQRVYTRSEDARARFLYRGAQERQRMIDETKSVSPRRHKTHAPIASRKGSGSIGKTTRRANSLDEPIKVRRAKPEDLVVCPACRGSGGGGGECYKCGGYGFMERRKLGGSYR